MSKHSVLLSLLDNTFTPYEEIKGIEKYYIDHDLKLVNATIEIHDPRTISPLQRSKIYALIGDISNHQEGYCDKFTKAYYRDKFERELIQLEFISEDFSLSNCSVTEANDYIEILFRFMFKNEISLEFTTAKMMKDEWVFLFMCIKHKTCFICGKHADIHHYDSIGMGNNRKTLDDSDKRKMALCREHHTEAHQIGRDTFCEEHHVKPIIYKEEKSE